MKNLQETMKQLQKASESLSRLSIDQEHPWKALSQMNQILDTNFWENLVVLSKHAAPTVQSQPQEITTKVKKAKKRRTKAPSAAPSTVLVEEEHSFFPTTDVFQTDHLVIVCCELPGFARDSLEVTLLDQRVIELRGRIREHVYAPSRVHTERTSGSFCRKIELPVSVGSKGMKAQYQDGLLELYLVRDQTMREKKATFRANL
ncbi:MULTISPECIES: Hsp20/alpha crystallin family protein [Brevibacillus]|uniref:Hsp20/alpha crystallin family protein n=1 Tax=Brevibacillus invocatus TaxID=173959 RepID=A0A3M8CJV3_9BACL|nr:MULTISPECIES: Hsp20/alpha crystallin family protein [Brevibacillus]MCM3078474.1 Hsp20/alpha crystallin family protein [Brevibacillus invocatus]MCM3428371.1 Hsp20/alpha crystallin family protein [Brevibacillus invocatus]MDH4616736.1 Hsp20/alpha crystallin family protein [Brevibacillus sp. AY1]RNB76022.1 Hsp20/alpha crystallin family protein [Brevibacillus invocatus]